MEVVFLIFVGISLTYYLDTTYIGLIGLLFFRDKNCERLKKCLVLKFRSPWVSVKLVSNENRPQFKRICGRYVPIALTDSEIYIYKTIFSYACSMNLKHIVSIKTISDFGRPGVEMLANASFTFGDDVRVKVVIIFYEKDNDVQKIFFEKLQCKDD